MDNLLHIESKILTQKETSNGFDSRFLLSKVRISTGNQPLLKHKMFFFKIIGNTSLYWQCQKFINILNFGFLIPICMLELSGRERKKADDAHFCLVFHVHQLS